MLHQCFVSRPRLNFVDVFFVLFFSLFLDDVRLRLFLLNLKKLLIQTILKCQYFLFIYLPHLSVMSRRQPKVKFQGEFNRFEFKVFLLLDRQPYQSQRAQTALLFTHSWKKSLFVWFPGVSTLSGSFNNELNYNQFCLVSVQFLFTNS